MTGTDETRISRRQASALAAALAATVVTALAAVAGFSHWNASAQPAPPAATQVVQQAPAPQWTEETD